MIEFRHVTKTLGRRRILNDLSFTVKDGETLVIVGPSGTGKSVTLNHITGLMKPDSGEIRIEDRDISKLSEREMNGVRRMTGMLFQSGALLNWMNVYDNVALPLREHSKLTEEEIREKIFKIFDILELSDSAKKMPSEISGGMQKRAGLARAVITEPRIMLYDEPTSGLDPVMSRKIDRLISALQKRMRMTSIVVTHDLCSAMIVADRIAMLRRGAIVECDTPENFMKSKTPIVREFIDAQFSTVNRS